MKQADYIRLTAQIAVLKEIAVDYSGKTIDNIIQQLEAIKKEVEHDQSRRYNSANIQGNTLTQ